MVVPVRVGEAVCVMVSVMDAEMDGTVDGDGVQVTEAVHVSVHVAVVVYDEEAVIDGVPLLLDECVWVWV